MALLASLLKESRPERGTVREDTQRWR